MKNTQVTFAQWFHADQPWIKANLKPDAIAMMQEIFDKRTAEGFDREPPPIVEHYEPPRPNYSRYCAKCAELSGLYWDDNISKYRCCECEAGREKAAGIWAPKAKGK
jgi:hypothetical protein